nr:DUF2252 family protein [Miltoncostaea oceani]
MLEAQAATRVPELTPIRYGRMLTSPFAFYRGAAGVMAADLAGTPVSGIRVQLCGDAHLSNFGFASSPERSLVFSVNDFDETLPGPWEWDVKRLAASCAVAARGQGRPGAAGRRLATRAVAAYRDAMREFAAMRDIDSGTRGPTRARSSAGGGRPSTAGGRGPSPARRRDPAGRTASARWSASRTAWTAGCASSATPRSSSPSRTSSRAGAPARSRRRSPSSSGTTGRRSSTTGGTC